MVPMPILEDLRLEEEVGLEVGAGAGEALGVVVTHTAETMNTAAALWREVTRLFWAVGIDDHLL